MHLQDSTEPQNVLKGLSVALHHTAVAADQRSVCTLLQVSKAWKTAVQQSAASKTDIRYTRNVSAINLSMITGFAGWIAKHPGLIGKLDVQQLLQRHRRQQLFWKLPTSLWLLAYKLLQLRLLGCQVRHCV